MTARQIKVLSLLALGLADFQSSCLGDEKPSLRVQWKMPAKCDPFAPVRIQDLKEELRQTGYRLVIAIHPDRPADAKGEPPPRDLYLINADGTGLEQVTYSDAFDGFPIFSPDGTKVVFASGRHAPSGTGLNVFIADWGK